MYGHSLGTLLAGSKTYANYGEGWGLPLLARILLLPWRAYPFRDHMLPYMAIPKSVPIPCALPML